MRLASLGLVLAAVLPAHAQDPSGPVPENVQRALELPGHRGLMAAIEAAQGVPVPFATDGCSGGLSSGWALVAGTLPALLGEDPGPAPPWEVCCTVHDRAYHAASGARDAEASYGARHAADLALRRCVQDVGASEMARDGAPLPYDQLSEAMFGAVRLGGAPCSGLPWRWGYGFAQCLPELP